MHLHADVMCRSVVGYDRGVLLLHVCGFVFWLIMGGSRGKGLSCCAVGGEEEGFDTRRWGDMGSWDGGGRVFGLVDKDGGSPPHLRLSLSLSFWVYCQILIFHCTIA